MSAPTIDHYADVRDFLIAADLRPELAARVIARIEARTPSSASPISRGRCRCSSSECAAEGEDLAAWSALLAARLEHESDGSFDNPRARVLLTAATQRTGEADTMPCEQRRVLEQPA